MLSLHFKIPPNSLLVATSDETITEFDPRVEPNVYFNSQNYVFLALVYVIYLDIKDVNHFSAETATAKPF